MPISLSRRSFLRGLFTAPIVVGAPELLVARPALPREPYVKAGTTVSYVGLALHPAPTFTGSRIVMEILPWNGRFYPVVLDTNGYRTPRDTETFPDHDLSDFRAEVPDRFWSAHSFDEWPNVHAWVRHQRYGEHPSVMLARMDAVRRGHPWPAAFAGIEI